MHRGDLNRYDVNNDFMLGGVQRVKAFSLEEIVQQWKHIIE